MMIAIKELLAKFGQALEVMAWEAIHWDIVKLFMQCEILLYRLCFRNFVAILKGAFL